jgi:hypothetical protein
MGGDEYVVTAEVWVYPGEAGWHFVTLPDAVADELRVRFADEHRAFGSLPVRATLGDSTWETSLFFDRKLDSYALPLKAAIRRREGVVEGQEVAVTLEPAP